MKLWVRFALVSTLLVVFILLGVGGLLFFSEKKHLLSNMKEQQNNSVQKLIQVCVESHAEDNDIILVNYINTLSKSPSIRYAAFIDQDGKVLVHSDMSISGERLSDEFTGKLLKAGGLLRNDSEGSSEILEVGAPVFYQNRRIGITKIGYDQNYLLRDVEATLKSAMVRFTYVCYVAIIFGLLGSVMFARWLTRPVNVLADATRIIGGGELTHRISVNRNDEIGFLANSFNDMAKRLQELDELKNEFVSSVSHELRSPLTAMKGFLQMFQLGITGPLNPQQQENITTMIGCADRLSRFVNNILDVAKLEAGMVDFNLEPIDPKAAAEEIVTLFRPHAESEKLKLLLDSPKAVPQVLGDADRVKQVLTNLISNAMKFTPEGGQVQVWIKEDGSMIKMGVKDTGAGIPKEAMAKLFNKFEQVKQTKSKARGKGTGLGLTIAKRIVEGCGGTMGVESELGKGSNFYFTLKKVIQPARAAA